jgi:ribonuclease T2
MKLMNSRRVSVWLSACIVAGGSFPALAAPTGYIMDVQMVPALCSLYPELAKKRKCLEGYSLNISGLFPETSQQDCSTQTTRLHGHAYGRVLEGVFP